MSRRVNHLYEFGPFRLDPSEHALLRDGQVIPLRPKVFDILLVLVQNHGHLVEKDELMRLVWAEQFVEEGNLNKNVSMLRQALDDGKMV
jgi:DNA-binding winged helix-turn-helix (wHTH) protein